MSVDLAFPVPMQEHWNIWDSSKIGGKPVWLDPEHVPDALFCKNCKSPLMLLAQCYLPLDDQEECYHRCIYVFICSKEDCISHGECVALRCQLPHDNKYYKSDNSSDVSDKSDPSSPLYWKNNLCNYCNQKSSITCEKCNKRFYCSKEHKIHDMLCGHMYECENKPKKPIQASYVYQILPELEVYLDDETEYIDEEKEKEIEKEYNQYLKQDDEFDSSVATDIDIKEVFKKSAMKDPYIYKFMNRVKYAKQQIMRIYQWNNSSILWVSHNNLLDEQNIPPCPLCGAPRKCEIQIMPQIIYTLEQQGKHIPSIDFGVINIYTCSESCSIKNKDGSQYVPEYTYIQMFDNTDEIESDEEDILEDQVE
ncbi:hypothetical protein WA158_006111 [Blastocystis sp. Blastoise]